MTTLLGSGGSAPLQIPPISLNRTSFVPYYRQVADQIRALIQEGKLSPGSAFWSEGELARDLGISKMTVRQAYQSLRLEGLLLVEKGKRPLVGAGRVHKNFQELRGFSEEMSRRGVQVSSKLLFIGLAHPDAGAQAALRLGKNDKVYRIQRLRFANNELVGLETSLLPASLFPGLEKHDIEKQSLYSVLENSYGAKLEWSEEELEAVPAKNEEVKLLRVAPRSPLFFMRRTVYSSEDVPVEYCLSAFRGDRYTATVISRRKP